MITELFEWAARTSFAALPLALAVLLLARVRFIQPRWRVWIAALLFLRLALPAVPEASWNVWSVKTAAVATSAATAADEGDRIADAAVLATESAAPSLLASFDWTSALAWLWLAGFLTTLGWLAASHFLTRRWILRNVQPSLRWFDALAEWARERQGVTQRVPVAIVRGLSTMAIFGWLRPRLLIPADLADRYTSEQIRGMLLHEFAHVRRRDVLWTWLALLACALHWFNPLAWLAFRRFCADRELVCDAAALAALGEGERLSYGDALLRSLEVVPLSPAPSLAPFFRIHPEIKHRILMITKPIQATVWSRFAAALLVPALSLVAFTTSRAQSATEKSREGEKPRSESREGERSREGARDGEAKKESALDKYKRENAERKAGARDGETKKEGARDGESRRSAEGDHPRRDGEREGDMKRRGSRDGEGEARKSAKRDGEKPREGARDGEGRKSGPRDGEVKKDGPRDGETRKEGERDGERSRRNDREKAADAERPAERESAASGEKRAEGEKPAEGEKAAEPETPENVK